MATRLAFGSSVSKPCHCVCCPCVCSRCHRRSAGGGSTSSIAPHGGCALRRLWHPDLLVVSRRRKRRPSGRSATRHRTRASSAQWGRDSRRTPYRGSCDEYRRPWWIIPLRICVARYPRGAGPRTWAAKTPAQDQGHPLSEHADDHGISRYDDTNPGGVSARSVLARRLRQRRPMQRLLQNPKQPANRPLHRPHRRVVLMPTSGRPDASLAT